MIHCLGGYCEMCPVKIQLECEMTITDRIDHIRQCLRIMKPTMGYELAAAAEIESELGALDESFAADTAAIEEVSGELKRLSEMIRSSLKGDIW